MKIIFMFRNVSRISRRVTLTKARSIRGFPNITLKLFITSCERKNVMISNTGQSSDSQILLKVNIVIKKVTEIMSSSNQDYSTFET
jgi:hypothetical protein